MDTLLDHWESQKRDLLGVEETGPFVLLKTDTEGWDLSVLQSNDWDRFSPEFVLSESTGSKTEIGQFLRRKGYELFREFPVNQLYRKSQR